MKTVKGQISDKHNHGAGGSIELQKPFLRILVPEFSLMYSGTINVQLDSPLVISKYDVETPPIEWRKGWWESFKIVRATIRFYPLENNKPIPCLLYYPGAGAYRDDPTMVEVVAPKLEIALNDGLECSITIP